MADQATLPILDHIVILVSQDTLRELPERLKDHFTVIVGGTHADGLTENDLILFDDGVYIEIIAFVESVDPEKRRQHRWGQLPENTIIDWAHTLRDASDFTAVQKRVSDIAKGYLYNDPVQGGRKRPDGEILRWAVAAASKTNGDQVPRGRLPFWCLDQTPRGLRVPYENNPQTKHPSDARGVARIRIHVREEEAPDLNAVYSAIHDQPSKKAWRFNVHSGATNGKREVSLHPSPLPRIELVLSGSVESPQTVEVLPGLSISFDN